MNMNEADVHFCSLECERIFLSTESEQDNEYEPVTRVYIVMSQHVKKRRLTPERTSVGIGEQYWGVPRAVTSLSQCYK